MLAEYITMRDGEPQIYAALATMRNSYTQMQWSRIQMAIAFNIIAFPVIFGVGPEGLKFAIAAAGVSMHLMLLHATIRADGWIRYLDGRLVELEDLDRDTESGVRIQAFSHPHFLIRRQSPSATRKFLGPVGLAVIVLWVYLAVRHGIKAFS